MAEPKVWTLLESLVEILEGLPETPGGSTGMFKNAQKGFFLPDKSSADNFPFAAIGVPEEGGFRSRGPGRSVDSIQMVLPLYAYFYIEDPAAANYRILSFLQRFVHEIEDMKHAWFDGTVSVIAGDFKIGDVLREMGYNGYEVELLPPFYGVRLELLVRIDDNSM